jgi:5-methylcytosine-specific restriction enzyme A
MASFEHAKRERNRESDRQRRERLPSLAWYRTREWKRLRAWQLKREPNCRMHASKGLKVKATSVDHKRPHKGDRALFFDPRNLQSLCTKCHVSAKQKHERSHIQEIGEDGWPKK